MDSNIEGREWKESRHSFGIAIEHLVAEIGMGSLRASSTSYNVQVEKLSVHRFLKLIVSYELGRWA